MSNRIDHIVWACPDLESGIDEFEALTGVRAQVGGKHPGLGTHNALLHLGERCYLEIVAPDPDQDSGPWSNSLRKMAEPGLLHWVVAASNLGQYASGLPELIGGQNDVMRIARKHPKLGMLKWQILMLPQHDYGCLVPFLIDWADSTHPTELLEQACTLRNMCISTPQLADIMKICAWLGIDADFVASDVPGIEFYIDTPQGEIRLATPEPLPIGVTFGD